MNYLGIDIGAGIGAKIGLFHRVHEIDAETLLYKEDFGPSFESFTDSLFSTVDTFLKEQGLTSKDLNGIGIACAGILASDGSFLLVQNLPHLTGRNLKTAAAEYFGIPVEIENDANIGGLAEWSVLQVELLYWVFGGGWGGAWISREGKVLFSSCDWDKQDSSLHYSNEPGYAIPLEKIALKTLFNEVNASYERLERVLVEEYDPPEGVMTGPGGDPDSLRAEVILSGPGRCRLFRAVVGNDDFYEMFLDIKETSQMSNPAVAGKYISKLSRMRVEAAINTDRLYGKILAEAARTLIKTASKDGLVEGVPICLGGKPSYALPYFGPSAQRALGKMGIMSYMRPSVIDERGLNANLVGAAVLARQVARRAPSAKAAL